MKKPGNRSSATTKESEAPIDIGRIIEEGVLIKRALKRATRRAALEHQRAGVPMVIFEDGKTKKISAEEFLHPRKNGGRKRKARR
jgi:hypothetical protein